MKNITFIALAAAAAALSLSSCQKNEIIAVESQKAEGDFTIYADFTKTSIDGLATKWAAGDAINVFHAKADSTKYGANSQFTISEEGLATGKFTGTLSGELAASNDWYALYPYNSKIVTPANTSGYLNIGCKNSSSTAQVQTGNNSTAHLAGQYFPLYAKATAIAKDGKVSLSFKPALSIVKFHITNGTAKPIIVSSLSLTAQEDIIGSYYIDFSGATPTFLGSGATYVGKTAKLAVNNGEEIAAGASADFYMAIKPFTNEAGSTLTFNVNGQERTSTDAATFACGKVKTVNFTYEGTAAEKLPYTESFAGTFGKFDVQNITLPSGSTYVWKAESKYAKASSYVGGSAKESESLLISPKIDLTSETKAFVSFDHAMNYVNTGNVADFIKLQVREFSGEVSGNWNDLTINAYPKGSDWTMVTNSTDISSYCGKVIQIALKYISTNSIAPTYEVNNFSVANTKTVAKITVDATKNVAVGSTVALGATVNSGATIAYSSDNNSVATVDNDGTIHGVAAGTATITLKTSETATFTAAEAVCTVTVSASTGSWSRVTTVEELTAGGTFIIGYEATANSGEIVPMQNTGTATTSAAGVMNSGTGSSASGSGTINMATVTSTSAYEVTIVASSVVSGAVCIKIGSNYLGNTNTKNNCKLFTEEATTTAFTPTVGANDVFTLKIDVNSSYTTLQYNSGSPRFAVYGGTQKNVVIYKKK